MLENIPSVSVIIPTYNREKCIAECIESVLGQTVSPEEILVIDDGSSDRTPEILASFGDKISVIRQENGGVSAARNAGLSVAKSEWVAFLDSDDIWLPNRMEIFQSDYQAMTFDGIVAHVCNIAVETSEDDENLFGIRQYDVLPETSKLYDDPLGIALAGVFSDGLIARKSLLVELGKYDINFSMHEDTKLYTRLALRGAWLLNNTIVGRVRRMEDDVVALSNQEVTDQEYVASAYVSMLSDLRKESLTKAQLNHVRRLESGALLEHARIRGQTDRGAARELLIEAAVIHPSTLKGWCKTLLPLVLGGVGFDLLFRSRKQAFRRG